MICQLRIIAREAGSFFTKNFVSYIAELTRHFEIKSLLSLSIITGWKIICLKEVSEGSIGKHFVPALCDKGEICPNQNIF